MKMEKSVFFPGTVGMKNFLSEQGIGDFGSNRDCLQT